MNKKHSNETEINISRFVSARADELSFFITKCKAKSKTPMQFLPKHLRRRAASSNPKRLPAAFRNSSCTTKKCKKNRKIRKPRALEYEKRSRRCTWLETHIWHSKRFHMADKWGRRMPLKHTDKILRPNFKAVQEKCTIQDLSFNQWIELSGSLEILSSGLSGLCKKNEGLTFSARCYVTGNLAGSIFAYTKEGLPIGPVSFLWNPQCQQTRKVWLICHPLIAEELNKALESVFERSSITNEDISRQINRFRLAGPLSRHILASLFKSEISKKYETDSIYSVLDSSDVISLQVSDPRLTLPKRRYEVPNCEVSEPILSDFTAKSASSELWEKEYRLNGVPKRENKYSNNSEEKKLDPTLIDVILFRDVDFQKSGESSIVESWSVLVPRGWAVPFWLNLVFRGARSIGLEEWHSICIDFCWIFEIPSLWPDTAASQAYQLQKSQDLQLIYKKRPPSKRVNHSKIGFTGDPFSCNWGDFFKEVQFFSVLRSRNYFVNVFPRPGTGCRARVTVKAKLFSQMKLDWLDERMLTLVRVESIGKGKIEQFSQIVLPRIEDVECESDGVDGEGRLVVGRVAEGMFSRRLGRSIGLGFCLTECLQSLCRSISPPIALIRTPSSQGVYRKVWLTPLQA